MSELLKAVCDDDAALIEALVKAGADVNQKTEGVSLLHEAAKAGKVKAIIAVVHLGAVIDSKDNNGKTPLHVALNDKGPTQALVIGALLTAGATACIQDNHGNTPLHYAAYMEWLWAVTELLKAGGGVNTQNHIGDTPLHVAVMKENLSPSIVTTLIQAGAFTEILNDNGVSPLHLASGRSVSSVSALLGAGAIVNFRCSEGFTPLHYAAYWGKFEVIEALLKAGALINALTLTNETPLDCALVSRSFGRFLSYDFLRSLGATHANE